MKALACSPNRDHKEAFVEFQTFEEISSYVLRKNILFRLVEVDQVPLGFRVFKQRLQRHRSP